MSIPAPVIGAITAEILNASIRFYFLYKRMQAMEGMTEIEIENKYQLTKMEFEKRGLDEIDKLINEYGG